MRMLLVLIMVMFIGCTSTKYVEVPVDNIRTEYRDKVTIDTIIKMDSVVVKDKGDTILLEKYKYLYRIKEVHDTVTVSDTVTVIKTIETDRYINRLNKWQIVLMVVGGIGIIAIVYKLIRIVKHDI